MTLTITRVRRMADLPTDLAENVRSWPHYQATSETHPDDRYPLTWRKGQPDEHTDWWDPLVSEDGERGQWRLTGYAEAATTIEGYRLFLLRMNHSTFTYGYMLPGSDRLNIGGRDQSGTKTQMEAWVAEQLALDVAPAARAGAIAHKAGRPDTWDEHIPGGWGARRITDPNMEPIVDGVWGLRRDRLSRAYREAWEAENETDRALAALAATA